MNSLCCHSMLLEVWLLHVQSLRVILDPVKCSGCSRYLATVILVLLYIDTMKQLYRTLLLFNFRWAFKGSYFISVVKVRDERTWKNMLCSESLIRRLVRHLLRGIMRVRKAHTCIIIEFWFHLYPCIFSNKSKLIKSLLCHRNRNWHQLEAIFLMEGEARQKVPPFPCRRRVYPCILSPS